MGINNIGYFTWLAVKNNLTPAQLENEYLSFIGAHSIFKNSLELFALSLQIPSIEKGTNVKVFLEAAKQYISQVPEDILYRLTYLGFKYKKSPQEVINAYREFNFQNLYSHEDTLYLLSARFNQKMIGYEAQDLYDSILKNDFITHPDAAKIIAIIYNVFDLNLESNFYVSNLPPRLHFCSFGCNGLAEISRVRWNEIKWKNTH
jgi:hypothetical protein